MKIKQVEKKIYEILGIRKFQKLLFIYEKLMSKVFKLDVGYRLDGMTMIDLMSYKNQSLGFGIAHASVFIMILIYDIFTGFNYINKSILAQFINIYCVMTQRYNTIRLNNSINKMTIKNKQIDNVDIINKNLNLEREIYNEKDFEDSLRLDGANKKIIKVETKKFINEYNKDVKLVSDKNIRIINAMYEAKQFLDEIKLNVELSNDEYNKLYSSYVKDFSYKNTNQKAIKKTLNLINKR